MNSIKIFFALFLTLLIGSRHNDEAQTESNHAAEIVIRINGLSDVWIYLNGVHQNVKSRIDSAYVNTEGKANFRRQVGYEPGEYTVILPDSSFFQLLLDQDQSFSLETEFPDLTAQMQVEGSLENELLYKSIKFSMDQEKRFHNEIQRLQEENSLQPEDDQTQQLRQQYFAEQTDFLGNIFNQYPNALFTKYQAAQQQPAVLRSILSNPTIDNAERQYLMLDHFWDNVDFSDERLLHTPVVFTKLLEYLYNYVPDQTRVKIQAIDLLMHKVLPFPKYYRFFAEWIAQEYQPPQDPYLDSEAIYVHMVDHYLTYERAFWADSVQVYAWQFRTEDKINSLIGKKGTDIKAKDPQGRIRALYDVRAPYVALFFYHAECDHCIEATPKLMQLYHEYKNKGLEVYAIAMDTPDKEWKKFITEQGVQWINVTDQDNPEIRSNYYIPGTPYIYLLNPNRTIIGKDVPIEAIPLLMEQDRRVASQ
ncbi:MAG: redoxin domain-containing protein [Cyclobacteriaceae bacterium]